MKSGSSRLANQVNDDGFTLVELLVVLAIIGLIAGFVAPQVLKYLGTARTEAARVQIRNIESALELFRLDAGRYPEETEGLESAFGLVTSCGIPSAEDIPQGPFRRRETA